MDVAQEVEKNSAPSADINFPTIESASRRWLSTKHWYRLPVIATFILTIPSSANIQISPSFSFSSLTTPIFKRREEELFEGCEVHFYNPYQSTRWIDTAPLWLQLAGRFKTTVRYLGPIPFKVIE